MTGGVRRRGRPSTPAITQLPCLISRCLFLVQGGRWTGIRGAEGLFGPSAGKPRCAGADGAAGRAGRWSECPEHAPSPCASALTVAGMSGGPPRRRVRAIQPSYWRTLLRGGSASLGAYFNEIVAEGGLITRSTRAHFCFLDLSRAVKDSKSRIRCGAARQAATEGKVSRAGGVPVVWIRVCYCQPDSEGPVLRFSM